MKGATTTTLVFLGSCLAFAEAALGTIAGFTDANATLVAVFALVALGLVLATLAFMYWRDPAFLTFTGAQALDLRRLQEILSKLPPELVPVYLESVTYRDLERNVTVGVATIEDTAAEEVEVVEREAQIGVAEPSEEGKK